MAAPTMDLHGIYKPVGAHVFLFGCLHRLECLLKGTDATEPLTASPPPPLHCNQGLVTVRVGLGWANMPLPTKPWALPS
jgi:hypothetical protein